MVSVEPATHEDIARLVGLEAALFREDAGRNDPLADTTWPDRPEAHVETYVANAGAQRLYERLGFEARSVSRALRL